MSGDSELKFDGPYSWILLVIIATSSFASIGFITGTASVYAGEYPILLNTSSSQTNIIGSFSIGSFLLSTPFMTPVSKQLGSRYGSLLAAALVLSGILVKAFARRIWLCVVGSSLPLGVGTGLMMCCSLRIVPLYFLKWQKTAYATIGFGGALGALAFPRIMSALLDDGEDFRTMTLYLLSICSVSLATPAFYKPRQINSADTSHKITIADFKDPLKHCFSVPYIMQSAMWDAGFIAFLMLLFTKVSGHYGTDIGSLCTMFYGVGQICAGIAMPLALFRFRLNHTILHICCISIGGISSLLFGFIPPNYIAYYILAVVTGMCHSFIITNLPIHIRFVFPEHQAIMMHGYANAAGGLGNTVSPMVSATIFNNYGSGPVYLYISCLLFGCVLFNLGIGLVKRTYLKKPSHIDDRSSMKETQISVISNSNNSDK